MLSLPQPHPSLPSPGVALAALAAAGQEPAPRARSTRAAPRRDTLGGVPSPVLTAREKALAAAAAKGLAAAGKATSTSTSTKAKAAGSAAKTAGALDFLSDPKLTTEEKLLRLLAYLEGKWEKELQAKLKELAQGQPAAKGTSASSSSSRTSGALGAAVKGLVSTVPGLGTALELVSQPQVKALLKQTGGPVLAAGLTAAGFPELAPAALKLGPDLVDGLAAAASAAGAGTKAAPPTGGTTRGGTSGSGTAKGETSPEIWEKLQLLDIQRIMDHQKEMFGIASSLLKAGHDLRMSVIQNVR